MKEDDNSLLHSVYNNDQEGVINALNKGANINAQNEHGETAFHVAAINGYTEIAQLLLSSRGNLIPSSRINLDLVDDIGLSAAQWAEKNGRTEIIKIINNPPLTWGETLYNLGETQVNNALNFANQMMRGMTEASEENSARIPSTKTTTTSRPESSKSAPVKQAEQIPKTTNASHKTTKQTHWASSLYNNMSSSLYNFVEPIARNITEVNQQSKPTNNASTIKPQIPIHNYKFVNQTTQLKEDEVRFSVEQDKVFYHANGIKVELKVNDDKTQGISKELYDKIKKTALSENITLNTEETENLAKIAKLAKSNQELFKAAITNDLEGIKKALANGADINYQNKDGLTALHMAVSQNNSGIVDILLESRADLDIKTLSGNTALHLAISKPGKDTIALQLIEHGANIHIPNNKGDMALHTASASAGQTRVILKLMEKEADIDLQNNLGNTAFYNIIKYNSELIRVFTENYNPDITIANNQSYTGIHYLARYCPEMIDEFPSSSLDTNVQTNDGDTALHFALIHENLDPKILQKLIPTDVNVINALDDNGNSLMHYAAMYGAKTGNFNVYTKLQQNGGDPTVINGKGVTPEQIGLNYAINNDKDHILDPNKNHYLHQVAMIGNPAQIEKLVARGGDINKPDELGNTPFHYALLAQTPENFYILDALGGNLDIKNKQGISVREAIKNPTKLEEFRQAFETKAIENSAKNQSKVQNMPQLDNTSKAEVEKAIQTMKIAYQPSASNKFIRHISIPSRDERTKQ